MLRIEQLVRCAYKTFKCRREASRINGSDLSSETFQNQLFDLVDRARSITGEDVGLSRLLQYSSRVRRKPTAIYTGIFETSPLVTVCIFVLLPKERIPLHSHPGMYGILKLIYGNLIIKSYSSLQPIDLSLPTITGFEASETRFEMDHLSEPALLTPDQNNLHEVINDSSDYAVFLDIISPRYENDNCYFSAKSLGNNLFQLIPSPCPSTFVTVPATFPLQHQMCLDDLID